MYEAEAVLKSQASEQGKHLRVLPGTLSTCDLEGADGLLGRQQSTWSCPEADSRVLGVFIEDLS